MRIDFVANGNRNGIKDDNRNRKPLPTTFYLTELDTVVVLQYYSTLV